MNEHVHADSTKKPVRGLFAAATAAAERSLAASDSVLDRPATEPTHPSYENEVTDYSWLTVGKSYRPATTSADPGREFDRKTVRDTRHAGSAEVKASKKEEKRELKDKSKSRKHKKAKKERKRERRKRRKREGSDATSPSRSSSSSDSGDQRPHERKRSRKRTRKQEGTKRGQDAVHHNDVVRVHRKSRVQETSFQAMQIVSAKSDEEEGVEGLFEFDRGRDMDNLFYESMYKGDAPLYNVAFRSEFTVGYGDLTYKEQKMVRGKSAKERQRDRQALLAGVETWSRYIKSQRGTDVAPPDGEARKRGESAQAEGLKEIGLRRRGDGRTRRFEDSETESGAERSYESSNKRYFAHDFLGRVRRADFRVLDLANNEKRLRRLEQRRLDANTTGKHRSDSRGVLVSGDGRRAAASSHGAVSSADQSKDALQTHPEILRKRRRGGFDSLQPYRKRTEEDDSLSFVPLPPSLCLEPKEDSTGLVDLALTGTVEAADGSLVPKTLLALAEESLVRRVKSYNEALRKDPKRPELWLEYAAFEESVFKLQRRRQSRNRRGMLEKQRDILSKGLEENPEEESLLLAVLRVDQQLDDFDTMLEKARQAAVQHYTSGALLAFLLNLFRGHTSDFSMEKAREFFADLIQRFRQQRQIEQTLGRRRLRRSPTHRHHPHSPRGLVHVVEGALLRVFSAWCVMEMSAGYCERAVSMWQALIEYNVLCPPRWREGGGAAPSFVESGKRNHTASVCRTADIVEGYNVVALVAADGSDGASEREKEEMEDSGGISNFGLEWEESKISYFRRFWSSDWPRVGERSARRTVAASLPTKSDLIEPKANSWAGWELLLGSDSAANAFASGKKDPTTTDSYSAVETTAHTHAHNTNVPPWTYHARSSTAADDSPVRHNVHAATSTTLSSPTREVSLKYKSQSPSAASASGQASFPSSSGRRRGRLGAADMFRKLGADSSKHEATVWDAGTGKQSKAWSDHRGGRDTMSDSQPEPAQTQLTPATDFVCRSTGSSTRNRNGHSNGSSSSSSSGSGGSRSSISSSNHRHTVSGRAGSSTSNADSSGNIAGRKCSHSRGGTDTRRPTSTSSSSSESTRHVNTAPPSGSGCGSSVDVHWLELLQLANDMSEHGPSDGVHQSEIQRTLGRYQSYRERMERGKQDKGGKFARDGLSESARESPEVQIREEIAGSNCRGQTPGDREDTEEGQEVRSVAKAGSDTNNHREDVVYSALHGYRIRLARQEDTTAEYKRILRELGQEEEVEKTTEKTSDEVLYDRVKKNLRTASEYAERGRRKSILHRELEENDALLEWVLSEREKTKAQWEPLRLGDEHAEEEAEEQPDRFPLFEDVQPSLFSISPENHEELFVSFLSFLGVSLSLSPSSLVPSWASTVSDEAKTDTEQCYPLVGLVAQLLTRQSHTKAAVASAGTPEGHSLHQGTEELRLFDTLTEIGETLPYDAALRVHASVWKRPGCSDFIYGAFSQALERFPESLRLRCGLMLFVAEAASRLGRQQAWGSSRSRSGVESTRVEAVRQEQKEKEIEQEVHQAQDEETKIWERRKDNSTTEKHEEACVIATGAETAVGGRAEARAVEEARTKQHKKESRKKRRNKKEQRSSAAAIEPAWVMAARALLRSLVSSVESSRYDPSLWLWMSVAECRMGQAREAKKILTRTLALANSFSGPARENLVRMYWLRARMEIAPALVQASAVEVLNFNGTGAGPDGKPTYSVPVRERQSESSGAIPSTVKVLREAGRTLYAALETPVSGADEARNAPPGPREHFEVLLSSSEQLIRSEHTAISERTEGNESEQERRMANYRYLAACYAILVALEDPVLPREAFAVLDRARKFLLSLSEDECNSFPSRSDGEERSENAYGGARGGSTRGEMTELKQSAASNENTAHSMLTTTHGCCALVQQTLQWLFSAEIELHLLLRNEFGSFSPRLFRDVTKDAVKCIPQHPPFALMWAWAERRFVASQRIKTYWNDEVLSARRRCGPSAGDWLLLIVAELFRAETDQKVQEAQGRSTAYWSKVASQRVRRVFERAVNSFRGRCSPLLWRLYLCFEVAVGNFLAGKRVWVTGIHRTPYSKALWLEGFALLLPFLGVEEAQELQGLMDKRELCLRDEPE